MKYQKTRYVLARVLAVILTLTAVFGLSAPLITQAASNVSVLYRYDGDGTETKNRVGIRSVIINDKKYFDIHDGSVTDRVDPNNQIAFLQAVLQSGNETDGGTDSLIGQWASLGKKTVQEMVMLMLLMHYHKKNLKVIERVEKIILMGQDLLMLRI